MRVGIVAVLLEGKVVGLRACFIAPLGHEFIVLIIVDDVVDCTLILDFVRSCMLGTTPPLFLELVEGTPGLGGAIGPCPTAAARICHNRASAVAERAPGAGAMITSFKSLRPEARDAWTAEL